MGIRAVVCCTAAVALFPLAMAGQKPSARDAFWSASDLISVTPNPAAHRAAKPHSNAAGNKPAAPSTAVAAASGAVSAPEPPRESQISELVSMNGYGAAPRIVQDSEHRLGLRCSILLRGAQNEYSEVTPGKVFHSGDHIRLSFLANQPGYFYVIQQGSSGKWSPIYPPRDAGAEASKIEAGKLQVVPGGKQAFAFDQRPGDEKLYVILSRMPIEDIDRVIRNLSTGKPSSAPDAETNSPELEAANMIPDAFVQKLASRDLTLVDEEKVDESSTPAHESEKAIYVVAKSTTQQDGSQVVVSLDLRHE